MKKTNGREKREHKEEHKIMEEKTDDDEGKRGKDSDHEICVITWNVNQTSAQYDFLSDAKCQANVVIFQETQNWRPDGTAEELGWTLLKEQIEGKATIAVKRKNMSLLRHSCTSTRWVLVVLGSILFLSMYLPHTWSGELNLEGYYKTLKEHARSQAEVQYVWHHCWNAQVEVKPNQGAFVGGGTRMSRGNTAKCCELESTFESLLMEWITKHEIALANTFCRNWEPTRAKTNKLDFSKQEEEQLQRWKIIDYIAIPIEWWAKSAVARDCRAQNFF